MHLRASPLSFRPFVYAILIHTVLIVALLYSRVDRRDERSQITRTLVVEMEKAPKRSGGKKRASGLRIGGMDLRPAFAKEGYLFKPLEGKNAPSNDSGTAVGESNAYSDELLNGDPRVASAFDSLALQINHFLDYPSLLFENGVQGTAGLDLYFDQKGEIDEVRSRFFGDHRTIRGLFVQASRKGLESWYRSAGARLRRGEFKNQHFHADFSISYLAESQSNLFKQAENDYRFVRRHFASVCANPMGVDIACLAIKGYGAVKRMVSDSEKVRFAVLQDLLDHYDDMGLSGLRDLIRGT